MALEMVRLKDGVRMRWDDGEVSSTVDLLGDDDQETLVRKLKRVIALAEGEQLTQAMDHLAQMPRMGQIGNYGGPLAPKAAEPPQLGPEQAANGWELLAPEDLDDAPGESG